MVREMNSKNVVNNRENALTGSSAPYVDADGFKKMFPGQFSEEDSVITGWLETARGFVSAGRLSSATAKSFEKPGVHRADRDKILYLTAAHLMTLFSKDRTGAVTGRISTATQGSVSVGLDYAGGKNGAWWNQTQYGAMVWELTAKYRSFYWISL